MWQFQTINNWQEIWSSNHINEWECLIKESPYAHVFYTPTLVKIWIDTYIDIRKISPIFIWGMDNNGCTVFMPLVLWKRNWKNAFIKCIVPVGYSDYDYHTPLFNKSPCNIEIFWIELIEYIRQHYTYDQIIIDGIVENLSIKSNYWSIGERCPSLNLKEIHNEDQLFRFLPTKLRGDIRRQIRRLSEYGNLSLKVYQSSTEAFSSFCTFLDAHNKKWPKAYKAPHFHQQLLEQGIRNNLVQFSSLDIDNSSIAWHLGFHYRSRFYYYMPAGDSTYANYSPVKIHLFYLIRWAIEHRFSIFDHLRGDENYKSGWSNECQHVCSFKQYSSNYLTQLKRAALRMRGIK